MDAPANVFDVDLRTFQGDVIQRSKQVPVVLLFTTDQVAPAVETRRTLTRLAEQYGGKFALAVSDVTTDEALAGQLRVGMVPAIRVIKDGQLVGQMDGPQGENVLRRLLDEHTQSPSDRLKNDLASLLEAKDYSQALAVLQQAIAAEPNNAGFKVEWADVLLLQGDLEGARTVLGTIPEGTEERARPATRLALLDEAASCGSLDDALQDAENDSLDGHYRAAVLLAAVGEYEASLGHAMEILRRDRSFRDDVGRLTMIRVMELLGKGSDVAKRYRRQMFNFLH